jgi:hypothetical protein
MKLDWTLPELMAADCEPCDACGEPFCTVCEAHYFDCAHPGPHSEAED